MRKEFLPFTKPAINEDDIQAVTDVLRSGWITNGPQNAALEQGICDYTGNQYGVALSSATAAMHILLKAMNIGPGDEVVTPSMTWVSIVNMIVLAGATPVFAEIDQDTMLVTPETLKAAITPRTKLIVPVHFAGAALDLDGLRAVAETSRWWRTPRMPSAHITRAGTSVRPVRRSTRFTRSRTSPPARAACS